MSGFRFARVARLDFLHLERELFRRENLFTEKNVRKSHDPAFVIGERANNFVAKRFDAAALRALPEEVLLRLLEGQIFRLGSKAPRLDRLERATEAVAAALEGRARLKLTLAEVLIEVTDASVTLSRAPPRSIRPRPAAGA